MRVDLERRQIDFALVDVLERAAAGARKGRPSARAAAAGGGRAGPRGSARPRRGRRGG